MSDDDEFDELMLAYMFYVGGLGGVKLKEVFGYVTYLRKGRFHTRVQEMRLNDRE